MIEKSLDSLRFSSRTLIVHQFNLISAKHFGVIWDAKLADPFLVQTYSRESYTPILSYYRSFTCWSASPYYLKQNKAFGISSSINLDLTFSTFISKEFLRNFKGIFKEFWKVCSLDQLRKAFYLDLLDLKPWSRSLSKSSGSSKLLIQLLKTLRLLGLCSRFVGRLVSTRIRLVARVIVLVRLQWLCEQQPLHFLVRQLIATASGRSSRCGFVDYAQHFADRFRSSLTEHNALVWLDVLWMFDESQVHDRLVAGSQTVHVANGDDHRCLPNTAAVHHGLVVFADGGRMVKNQNLRIEILMGLWKRMDQCEWDGKLPLVIFSG